MRLVLTYFRAVSLYEQAKLIEKCFINHGHEVLVKPYISLFDVIQKLGNAYLWFVIANPTWLIDIAPVFIEAKQSTRNRAFVYATIEGIPYPHLARWHATKYIDFIANSYFTKECLEKANLRVIDVIHHAIDFEEVERAKKLAEKYQKKLRQDFKDRVIFVYVGRDDHRKQLDRLMQAIDILNEKAPNDFVLLLHTELRRQELFKRPNVYIVGDFGSRSHEEVLGLLGACDYLVFPSACEGFGLPVLETLAMGRPVVCCKMKPLIEFTNEKCAIYFEYDHIEYWKTTAEQYFVMHLYDPEELANAMLRAIDIRKNNKDLYMNMCIEAYNTALNFDYKKVYKKFIEKCRW